MRRAPWSRIIRRTRQYYSLSHGVLREVAMRVLRQAVSAAGMVLALTGCMSWRRIEVPTPPAQLRTYRESLRVRLDNREVFHLVNVVIVTDSLFGTTDDISAIRMGVALREVDRIDRRQKDNGRTILAIAGITAVVLFSGMAGTGIK
ncbi:MAG TPA: hypothetical protein VLE53_16980 [Gemmatimonadaceae bacterium]|nr:hypothetical protein [Gemmatimonadaceae bacterium]